MIAHVPRIFCIGNINTTRTTTTTKNQNQKTKRETQLHELLQFQLSTFEYF